MTLEQFALKVDSIQSNEKENLLEIIISGPTEKEPMKLSLDMSESESFPPVTTEQITEFLGHVLTKGLEQMDKFPFGFSPLSSTITGIDYKRPNSLESEYIDMTSLMLSMMDHPTQKQICKKVWGAKK